VDRIHGFNERVAGILRNSVGLGDGFGTDPQFWLNLQSRYDLALADRATGSAVR